MGIALANYPEFSLWTFLSGDEQMAMASVSMDQTVHWWMYLLVDGKFYTIFSVLFGIGFSIIIDHAMQRGADGFRIFYRRMCVLLLMGFAHLMLIWSGDILLLYAARYSFVRHGCCSSISDLWNGYGACSLMADGFLCAKKHPTDRNVLSSVHFISRNALFAPTIHIF